MLIYESLKKILTNPVFYFLSIGMGLVFTVIFAHFNPGTATWISGLVFISVILISLLVAFLMEARRDIPAVARYINEMGKHRLSCLSS